MADGHTHFKMSLVVDAVIGGALIWMAQEGAPVDVFDGVVIGAIIGTVITPDFDLVGTTYTEKLLRSIPILGLLLQVSWYPYALLSKHRGLSHTHVLGTLSRALYMMIALIVWTWGINGMFLSLHIDAVQHLAGTILDYCASNATFTVSMFIAWALHDEMHILLDGGKRATSKSQKGLAWTSTQIAWTKKSWHFGVGSVTQKNLSAFVSSAAKWTVFCFSVPFLFAMESSRYLSSYITKWLKINFCTPYCLSACWPRSSSRLSAARGSPYSIFE